MEISTQTPEDDQAQKDDIADGHILENDEFDPLKIFEGLDDVVVDDLEPEGGGSIRA